METSKLKKFAQSARRNLIEQVSNKLKLVIAEDSAARRENAEAVKKLEQQIASSSKEQVIEKVAYIWFNRFCALRFMDVNRYTRMGVVSPTEGQSQPEILAEAKMGHIDEKIVPEETRQLIFSLLDGSVTSNDPQAEAYRLLIVAVCNNWNASMPFMFERITDYTELLMPDDLLSGSSVLADTREAMTPDICEDVEVIGWLYQFYISEKKDEVFDGLKKNKKITPENIPAATQLFTPHWIVRYLVENSLGRLWMLNRPDSGLLKQMDYYIKPEQPEADFLQISSPEEIKICDPACGSGHMLTYAFDLLYAIYEEEGYESAEIPEKILTNNLFGVEIDERAGELAAFALTMKARDKQRRFFRKSITPKICVLGNVQFDEGELKEYMEFIGRDLFTAPLQITLRQFEEADNFGSLIRPEVTDVDYLLRTLDAKDVSEQLFLNETHKKVLLALKQADYLSPKYHVVIANPPYMNMGGMNPRLKSFLGVTYPDSKSDLMTCFMERAWGLVREQGYWAMINLPSWLFLQSFASLRDNLIQEQTINSLLHLGRGVFGSDFGTVAFVIKQARPIEGMVGTYRRLFDEHVEVRSIDKIESLFFDKSYGFYQRDQRLFKKVPSSPLAYWIKGISLFDEPNIGKYFLSGGRNKTHDNEKYLRFLWEISRNSQDWELYCNGGDFRKYYGNELHVIDWSTNAKSTYDSHGGLCNPKFWNKEGLTCVIPPLITEVKCRG